MLFIIIFIYINIKKVNLIYIYMLFIILYDVYNSEYGMISVYKIKWCERS